MHVYVTVMSNSPFWRMSQSHLLLFPLNSIACLVYVFKTKPSPAKGKKKIHNVQVPYLGELS